MKKKKKITIFPMSGFQTTCVIRLYEEWRKKQKENPFHRVCQNIKNKQYNWWWIEEKKKWLLDYIPCEDSAKYSLIPHHTHTLHENIYIYLTDLITGSAFEGFKKKTT